jgi:hypothetical protein|tara:strand:- start:51 stop:440 length:390 start_codon:yes stop_codon:yes gene_type:complete
MIADFTKYSLALVKDGEVIFSSDKSGLRPLVECVKKFKSGVEGCVLHDKVVGLAAARLIVYSGIVSSVVTKVCSKLAKELLDKSGIEVGAGAVVDNILNWDKSDVCPMEKKAVGMENEEFFSEMSEKFV